MNKMEFASRMLTYMARLDIKLGLRDMSVLMGLLSAYFESHRKYHNWVHILEGLEEMVNNNQVSHLTGMEKQLLFMMWVFHDISYEPEAISNEIRSAYKCCCYVKQVLGKNSGDCVLPRVLNGILATDHGGPPSDDPLIQLLCDIDLVRLACPWDEFKRHTADIRFEYSHVSDQDFRAGRVKILRLFSVRPSIYLTDDFKRRYEDQAFVNLTRALHELEAPP